MCELSFHIVKLLSDIHNSAERILVMLDRVSSESFVTTDAMTLQDAVARRFIIIGEASATLLRKYPDFCEKHPEIPWRQARGLRNFLVHDYDGLDWALVWRTAKDLPNLMKQLEPFLEYPYSDKS